MSNEAQSWAWKQECAHASDKSVLVALADNAWEDGSNAWPSVALLARKTGLCTRTVQRSLQRLLVDGFIAVQAEAQSFPARPTTYRVCLERLSPPVAESPPDTTTPGVAESPPDTCHPLTLSPSPPDTVTPEPLKNPKKKSSRRDEPDRIDVQSLCNRLAEWLKKNGAKVPDTKSAKDGWRREARLLLDRDERPLDEALDLVDWCQQHHFWHTNILSMDKFRKQYDQMRLQMKAPQHQRVANSRFDADGAYVGWDA